VGKREGKKPLGRPRHVGVDMIKMDLREIGWDGMTDLAQDSDQWRVVLNTKRTMGFHKILEGS
jgi:hypothetical protein